MYTVYALIDQRYDTTRYIGIINDVYARFSQHINCAGNNIDKNEWVQDLKAHGVMLVMKTIETVDTLDEALSREQFWIHQHLQNGDRLLNVQVARSFTYDDFMDFFGGKPDKQEEKLDVKVNSTLSVKKKSDRNKVKISRMLRKNPDMPTKDIARKVLLSESYVRKIRSEISKEHSA